MTRRHPADGTIGHPYSALNLRLALALFGLVFMLAVAAVAWWLHAGVIAAAAGIFAALALINVIVVQRRRRQRQRREPGAEHSLFE